MTAMTTTTMMTNDDDDDNNHDDDDFVLNVFGRVQAQFFFAFFSKSVYGAHRT